VFFFFTNPPRWRENTFRGSPPGQRFGFEAPQLFFPFRFFWNNPFSRTWRRFWGVFCSFFLGGSRIAAIVSVPFGGLVFFFFLVKFFPFFFLFQLFFFVFLSLGSWCFLTCHGILIFLFYFVFSFSCLLPLGAQPSFPEDVEWFYTRHGLLFQPPINLGVWVSLGF